MPDKDTIKKQAGAKGQSQTTTPRASPPRSSPPPKTSPPQASPPKPSPAPPVHPTPPAPTSPQNTALRTALGLATRSTQPLTLQPLRGPPPRGQIPAPAPANTYTPQDRDALQHKSADATEEHLVLATDLVVGKLAANQVPYALMGGFSLRMRGSVRLTRR